MRSRSTGAKLVSLVKKGKNKKDADKVGHIHIKKGNAASAAIPRCHAARAKRRATRQFSRPFCATPRKKKKTAQLLVRSYAHTHIKEQRCGRRLTLIATASYRREDLAFSSHCTSAANGTARWRLSCLFASMEITLGCVVLCQTLLKEQIIKFAFCYNLSQRFEWCL